MQKQFKHFKNPDTVYSLIDEIKNRYTISYEEVITSATEQLKAYFQSQFPSDDLTGGRSRFAGKSTNVIRPRFLVALSGGIDSSVVTSLAVKAVGTDAVLPITMPGRPDDENCLKMSALVRENLGFDKEEPLPYEIDLEPIIQTHRTAMTSFGLEQIQLGEDYFSQSKEEKMRSGNFASRVRAAVLYDFARSVRGRILGTVNRTEFCQGYNTKFGTPISYDFGVLNEFYKIEIYELAKILNVPEAILQSEPSTGYFEGQTHEGELGATIEEQDIFAYLLFEKNLSVDEIVKRYDASSDFAKLMAYRYRVCDHKRILNEYQAQINMKDKRP